MPNKSTHITIHTQREGSSPFFVNTRKACSKQILTESFNKLLEKNLISALNVDPLLI